MLFDVFWLLGEDREFLGLGEWGLAVMGARPVGGGRSGLGLEFYFAVGEAFADTLAFSFGEIVVL
jgi:hypothetical protein